MTIIPKSGAWLIVVLVALSLLNSASADAVTTPTALTCRKKTVTGGACYSRAHCRGSDAATSGAPYEAVAIEPGLTTRPALGNQNVGTETKTTSPFRLKSVRAGVEVEIQATGVEEAPPTESFPSRILNREEGGGTLVEGEGRIAYSGVTVARPAGKGCLVAGGLITTAELSTRSVASTTELSIAPLSGTQIATFAVSGCSVAGLSGVYEVTGSLAAPTDGATLDLTHTGTTSQGTLFLGGQNAGVEGELTLSGKAPADPGYTPLAIGAEPTPPNNSTAMTCRKKPVTGGAGYSRAHCRGSDAATSGAPYEAVAIEPGLTTRPALGNQNVGTETKTTSPFRLKSVRAGVEVEIQATGVEEAPPTESFPSRILNREEGGGTLVEGEGRIAYSGVTVAKPASKGCIVEGGSITTKELSTKSSPSPTEMVVKPASGTTLATFGVSNCSVSGLNGAYEVTGRVRAPIDGATLDLTHTGTTSQGTLFLGGQNAGIEGELTLSGKAPADPRYTPLAIT